MCGVAGYIRINAQSFNSSEQLLESFHKSLEHRGPDGFGVWVDGTLNVALIHRRLSILDLSAVAAQPMLDRDGKFIISFNGEIYNYQELRRELEACGHVFISSGDTEVFLYAFKQWGISCLDKLEGMFAAILGDLEKNEWYLVRDRMGIKPIYFSLQGGYFSFASEIKALWHLPWISKKINSRALYHYLTFLVAPVPLTFYDGVYKLPSSYYAKISNDRVITFHEYYNPLQPKEVFSKTELQDENFCIERIRALLYDANKKYLASDVPYGAFLSGGVDSSLNVAYMSQFSDKLKTFNVEFSDGKQYSEVEWARKVSKQFNTEHYEVSISEKEAFEFFEKMIYHNDEPIADAVSIPLYYVSKLAKDSGVTVVQVGEGADELYCGYPAYTAFLDSKRKAYESMPYTVRKAGNWLAARLCPDTPYPFTLFDKWSFGEKRHLFWGGTLAFDEKEKQLLKLQQPYYHDSVLEMIYPSMGQDYDSHAIVDYHMTQLHQYDPQADFLKSMIYLDLKQRLPELLLTRMDKMTMAASVEARVPFLDHKHVEFALQVPSALKYKQGQTKYILKKACEGILPHDVIYRKKMGFASPFEGWLKKGNYFKAYFQDVLVSKKNDIEQVMSYQEVQRLFKNNQQPGLNYGLECWLLQNFFFAI